MSAQLLPPPEPLQLFLSRNRSRHIAMLLPPHEHLAAISRGKALNASFAVREAALQKITGYADINRAVALLAMM